MLFVRSLWLSLSIWSVRVRMVKNCPFARDHNLDADNIRKDILASPDCDPTRGRKLSVFRCLLRSVLATFYLCECVSHWFCRLPKWCVRTARAVPRNRMVARCTLLGPGFVTSLRQTVRLFLSFQDRPNAYFPMNLLFFREFNGSTHVFKRIQSHNSCFERDCKLDVIAYMWSQAPWGCTHNWTTQKMK